MGHLLLHILFHIVAHRGYTVVVNDNYDPLVASPPAEVPLPAAPLVRVIAQVRFPVIVSLEKQDFIGPFQEAIRDVYPVLRPEQIQGFVRGPQGLSPLQSQVVWRFGNENGTWRVSLGSDFVALETTTYTSRGDFVQRLGTVIDALQRHIAPKTIDRVGVRYIDRITGDAVKNIEWFVRPELLGVAATSAARHARHTLSESLFAVPNSDAELRARWGSMPARGTVDPAAIEPIDEPSWILDLDMFRKASRAFDKKEVIMEDARLFAERIYAFFRWAVTEDFLRHYGGEV